MRRLAALLLVLASAGCVQAGTDAIDDARARHGYDDEPEESTAPTPAPEADWPREGSYAEYETRAVRIVDGRENATSARVRWTYEDGAWRGACALAWRTEGGGGTLRRELDDGPPIATREPPAAGEDVRAWHAWDCRAASTSMVFAGVGRGLGPESEQQVYLAREPAASDEDFLSRWDPVTGLVLDWTWARSSESTAGRLVGTDAPLAP